MVFIAIITTLSDVAVHPKPLRVWLLNQPHCGTDNMQINLSPSFFCPYHERKWYSSLYRYCTGYAFAYGDPDPSEDGSYSWKNPFIGHRFFFQINLPRSDLATWFFQFTFAATAATIVSGAVAERCRFATYVCYNSLLVSFVYPVVAHWVWSPFGWMSAWRTAATSSGSYTLLFGSGVYDFAGDGPVHMIGGFASLAGAWILGPRIGRFNADGCPVDMPGHNASLTLLGVFLLWFGWFGFNPGSTTAIIYPTEILDDFVTFSNRFGGFSSITAAAAVNTTVSAASATIATLFISMLYNYIQYRAIVWDLIIAGNGALGGLVAITGSAAFVETWAAWVIGFIGGAVYYFSSKFILHVLKVDDPLDAIAVHAACGAWGMIGSALFAAPNLVGAFFGPAPGAVLGSEDQSESLGRSYGLFMGGGGRLLAAHCVYIIVIAAWTLGIMTPFFFLLKKIGIFRVPAEVEMVGLDVSYHGGSSYPGHDPVYAGGAHRNGRSSARTDMMERKELIQEAINEALYEVERRGWTPPQKTDGLDADVTLGKAKSLADLQKTIQENYASEESEGKEDTSRSME